MSPEIQSDSAMKYKNRTIESDDRLRTSITACRLSAHQRAQKKKQGGHLALNMAAIHLGLFSLKTHLAPHSLSKLV